MWPASSGTKTHHRCNQGAKHPANWQGQRDLTRKPPCCLMSPVSSVSLLPGDGLGAEGWEVEMGGRSSRSRPHPSVKEIRNRNFKHNYEQAIAITSTNHSSLCWTVGGEKSRGQRTRAASFLLCSFKSALKFKPTQKSSILTLFSISQLQLFSPPPGKLWQEGGLSSFYRDS